MSNLTISNLDQPKSYLTELTQEESSSLVGGKGWKKRYSKKMKKYQKNDAFVVGNYNITQQANAYSKYGKANAYNFAVVNNSYNTKVN